MRADTSERLLGAARRAFAEQGYAAASMDALCAKAGVTRGALYHLFGGKDGLFEAVIRRIEAEIVAELQSVSAEHADGVAGLKAALSAYLAKALEPEIRQILIKDAPAVLGARLQAIDDETSLAPLAQALGQLMADGRIRRCDCEAAARLLNGALNEAALWIGESKTPKATHKKAEAALMALIDGLALKP